MEALAEGETADQNQSKKILLLNLSSLKAIYTKMNAASGSNAVS